MSHFSLLWKLRCYFWEGEGTLFKLTRLLKFSSPGVVVYFHTVLNAKWAFILLWHNNYINNLCLWIFSYLVCLLHKRSNFRVKSRRFLPLIKVLIPLFIISHCWEQRSQLSLDILVWWLTTEWHVAKLMRFIHKGHSAAMPWHFLCCWLIDKWPHLPRGLRFITNPPQKQTLYKTAAWNRRKQAEFIFICRMQVNTR